MSLNIWILNHYAGHPCGCSNTRHYSLARHLVAAGHSVTIFSSAFDHATRQQRAEPSSEEVINEVRFVWLPTGEYKGNDLRRVRSFGLYLWQAVRAGWRKRPKPHLVWGSSPHPLAALAAYILARRHRAKFLFEVRDVWPEALVDLGGYSPRHPAIVLLGMLVAWLYRRADGIISVLPGLVGHLKARGISAGKLLFLPNALEGLGFSRDVPEDVRRQLDGLTGRVKVVYAGAHGQGNNLDEVLRLAKCALGKQPDLQFVLIGDGPEKGRLQQSATECGLSNVTFLPPIPRYVIGTVLREMDIGLVSLKPARVFEVFGISPNKLASYREAGLPVLILGPAVGASQEAGNLLGASAGFPDRGIDMIRRLIAHAPGVEPVDFLRSTAMEFAKELEHVLVNEWSERDTGDGRRSPKQASISTSGGEENG